MAACLGAPRPRFPVPDRSPRHPIFMYNYFIVAGRAIGNPSFRLDAAARQVSFLSLDLCALENSSCLTEHQCNRPGGGRDFVCLLVKTVRFAPCFFANGM